MRVVPVTQTLAWVATILGWIAAWRIGRQVNAWTVATLSAALWLIVNLSLTLWAGVVASIVGIAIAERNRRRWHTRAKP